MTAWWKAHAAGRRTWLFGQMRDPALAQVCKVKSHRGFARACLASKRESCSYSLMEMAETPQWRIANLLVLLFVVICAIISVIPARAMWFGFLPNREAQLILSVAAGVAIYELTKRYVQAIAAYTPQTSLQAKRANEQIKITANFANTIAAAWISVVALSQLIRPAEPDYYIIAFTVLVAGFIHGGARNMVGLIKDETALDNCRTGSNEEGG